MDYFFQEQRWTDTFLSLHVKKFKRIILFLLIAFSATGAKAQSDVKFNDGVRYSQWVIDSRMNDFYANTTHCGFAVYNQEGTQTSPRVDGKTKLDYVVGLVAKSIIEASQYYSQYDWAKSFAKPWFLSIQNYGDYFYNQFRSTSGSLDDLNAVKLFLPLRELTAPNATYANSTTYANTASALNTALSGLRTHNTQYSIGSETLAKTAGKTVAGGWWHKSDYQDQMWLDGSYMGPALFAQLVNYKGSTKNIDANNDWELIVKQFTILRSMCWNPTDKLLYHAFAADGGTNSTSHSDTWYGLSDTDPYVFHSASYWGRAVGWYFLALVDVLEQMQKANIASTDSKFTILKGYLEEIAEGIKNRQDQLTGGWYQILDKNNKYSASSYNGKSYTQTYNYIESSATALFTAAYLKAIRLGYLAENDYKTVAEDGYKCLVNNFFSVDANGKVNIFGSCRSAGLGGKGDNYKAGKERYRDGSKEYYLLGYDVAKVEKTENKTEGKVLGAFIMAATEYERLYQPSTLLSKDLNSTYTLNSNESLTVEVLGDGTPTYQWYDATTKNPIEGATDASYTPTKSGKYYCVIKVTAPSTSAKTRTASGSYTITTRTADVTVSGTSTGDTGNTGGESSTTGTAVTEVVTFQNQTPTVTYSMTPADATKIEVTAAGIDNSNKYLLSEYTAFVKMNSDGSLSLNIPDGATNINVTLLSSSSVNNLKLNSDSNTSTTWTGNDTDGYTYSFDIANSLAGTTYTIKKGVGISYIHKITITYSLGSSTEPAPSTDASARFTYNGLALSFTENVATITLESSQANSSITVNAAPATGASITTSSASTSIADNVITITAPAAGSSASYIYTVKAADGTKTQVYTINVTVKPYYSYNVKGKTKPECNESRFIEDGSGNKLVKFTFGGWKYNNNKYLKPHADDIDANYITDGWSDPATQAKVNALDGYEYAISGKNDAVQEDKTATKEMYGKTRYGWFESPTRDKNGVTTDSHPYTLPVRGAYMTFEPTQNGTLTIYLLQNGAWNSDTKNHIDIIPGEFRMHAFQITNQRGLVLAEFAPKYSITTNQKVADGYSCTKYLIGEKPAKYDKTSKDVSNWEEFWALDDDERQAVYDNWKNGNNGSQTIIKLKDGSFLAIQKAIVKYEFHVTGNETYYVFSNFSKLGFSGATFQPDAQPQATVEGKISQLELSDVTAYNEITATPKNSNIEGTELKDYTYTIGGTEIAPVAGVYIPQFYSIKLTRTFKKDQWTTLSLPFNLTQTEVEQIFGKGTQIIVFDKAKITSARTYLTFFYHEIQNVLPGYPYLIRPTLEYDNNNSNSADNAPIHTITDGNLTEFTVYNKAINPHIKPHEFKSDGYTAKCTPSYCTADETYNNIKYSKRYKEGDIFVSEGNGTVYISEGSSYGKGYRSYIEYTGKGTPPSAKALSISFCGVEDGDDNGTTTEIRVAELADDVIETLGIGGVYNLNGQKVADTTRNLPAGIYIVNGRKFVVK